MDLNDLKKHVRTPRGVLRLPPLPSKHTTDQVRAPKHVARFDSGWGMLQALSNCLIGKDFPGLGALPGAKPIELVVGRLDTRLGQRVYALTGWTETVPPEEVESIRADDISRAVVNLYPKEETQAVFIGSANGAVIHLAAALRAPWLPQTFLIPLKRPDMDPDDISADMEWGQEPGRILLKNNPDLILHHAHDPDHDRLMVRRMAYFRIKRRVLGESYSRYLEDKLRSGATIYIVDCGLNWPTTKLAERHFFQTGGAGGVPPDEYLYGSERVAKFLERQGSKVRRWDAPPVDGERPEAEWGFQPELAEDVVTLGRRLGGRVVHIRFDDPHDMSPLIADFYRWWYQLRGIQSNHLLAESFAFLDPYWTLRTGSVPFWLLFSGRYSADKLTNYLSSSKPYDHIYMMLLSNGINPIEGVSIEDWRRVLRQAAVRGEFIGVDEDKFPFDFASFLRYNSQLQSKIQFRYDLPAPATLDELEVFLEEYGHQYQVKFEVVT